MTVDLFPAVHDVEAEHYAPRGFNTPQTFLIPTHDVEAEHRPNANPGSTGPGAILHLLPPAYPALGNWVVKVTDMNGGVYATLTDKFTVTQLHWQLNGQGDAQISGPMLDPNLDLLFTDNGKVIDGRELQVERDDIGVLMHVVPAPRATPRVMGLDSYGAPFHLTHKFVGRNNAVPNFIRNGNFDTDISEWSPNGSMTGVWSAAPVYRAPGAVVLSSGAAGNNYLNQLEDIPSQPFDTFMWFSAWIYLDGSIDVQNLATSGRALWTVWRVGGTVVWQQGVSPNWRATGWQNLRTKVFLPKDQTVEMETRLYVPLGEVRYDDVYAHREERLNCEGDPGTIVTCLVAHAQDTGLGKSDVNLGVDTSRGGGGVNLIRRYKYAEAAQIFSAANQMAQIAFGVDTLCEYPATNTRTIFTMERTGYDVGDTDRANLVWGDNLNGWEWTWNPAKRNDIVRVQGRGSGDEVTEAVYNDSDSDLGWEFVRYASIEGSPVPQDQADGIGAQFKRPNTIVAQVVRTATFDVANQCATTGGRAGSLLPGRLVDVSIDHGPIHVASQYKIIDTILDTLREVATLQLVPVEELES